MDHGPRRHWCYRTDGIRCQDLEGGRPRHGWGGRLWVLRPLSPGAVYCLTYDPSTLVDLPGLGDDSGVGLGGAQGMYACMSETLARRYLTSDALAGVIISSAIHPCPLRGFDMLQAPARH